MNFGYESFKSFVLKVISRSVQYYRNEAEFYDEEDDQFKYYWDFSEYLDDLLLFIASPENYKKFLDDSDEDGLPFDELSLGELYDDIDK